MLPLVDPGTVPRDTDLLDGDSIEVVQWAVGVVSARVRAYTRVCYPAGEGTVILVGTTGTRLDIARRPLHAVTAVSIDGVALDLDDLRWNRRGVLHRAGGWTDDLATVVVEGTWGWPLGQCPPELAAVTASAASRLAANPHGLRSITRGENDSVTFGGDVDAFTLAELAVLRRWRTWLAA